MGHKRHYIDLSIILPLIGIGVAGLLLFSAPAFAACPNGSGQYATAFCGPAGCWNETPNPYNGVGGWQCWCFTGSSWGSIPSYSAGCFDQGPYCGGCSCNYPAGSAGCRYPCPTCQVWDSGSNSCKPQNCGPAGSCNSSNGNCDCYSTGYWNSTDVQCEYCTVSNGQCTTPNSNHTGCDTINCHTLNNGYCDTTVGDTYYNQCVCAAGFIWNNSTQQCTSCTSQGGQCTGASTSGTSCVVLSCCNGCNTSLNTCNPGIAPPVKGQSWSALEAACFANTIHQDVLNTSANGSETPAGSLNSSSGGTLELNKFLNDAQQGKFVHASDIQYLQNGFKRVLGLSENTNMTGITYNNSNGNIPNANAKVINSWTGSPFTHDFTTSNTSTAAGSAISDEDLKDVANALNNITFQCTGVNMWFSAGGSPPCTCDANAIPDPNPTDGCTLCSSSGSTCTAPNYTANPPVCSPLTGSGQGGCGSNMHCIAGSGAGGANYCTCNAGFSPNGTGTCS